MPTYTLRMRQLALTVAVASLLVSTVAIAQTGVNTAAVWRATSRFGYGPSEMTAQAAQQNPEVWVPNQSDTAYAGCFVNVQGCEC